MVRRFNINKKDDVVSFLDFITKEYSPDFFYTRDNTRHYIKNEKNLRTFIKECSEVLILEGETDLKGVIVTWVAKGGDVKRDYIKLAAKTQAAADALLNVLLWNFEKDTYVKILKKSQYLKLFYSKGFKFKSDRGKQLLLKRDKNIFKKQYKKDKQ